MKLEMVQSFNLVDEGITVATGKRILTDDTNIDVFIAECENDVEGIIKDGIKAAREYLEK